MTAANENHAPKASPGSKSPNVGVPRRAQPKLKMVVRRLPPSMTETEFLEVVGPLPRHDYFYYSEGNAKMGPFGFSRAYVGFTNHADLVEFGQKFDNYVFVDQGGAEYPAVVEYAPFQRLPRRQPRPVAGGGFVNPGGSVDEQEERPVKSKADLSGTYESDPLFQEFLEKLNGESVPVVVPTPEDFLAEIEAREKELKANNGVPATITPLIEFVRERMQERERFRNMEKERQREDHLHQAQERREEKRRVAAEKRRQRQDDRRRKRERKEEEPPPPSRDSRPHARPRPERAEQQQPQPARAGRGGRNKKEEAKKRQEEQPIPSIKLLRKPPNPEEPQKDPESKEKPSPAKVVPKEKDQSTRSQPSSSSSAKEPIRSSVFVPSSKRGYRGGKQAASVATESPTKSRPSTAAGGGEKSGKAEASAKRPQPPAPAPKSDADTSESGTKEKSSSGREAGDASAAAAAAAAKAERERRRNKGRPSMEIYRPPPRRGGPGGGHSESATTPEPTRDSPEPPKRCLQTSGARNDRRDRRVARAAAAAADDDEVDRGDGDGDGGEKERDGGGDGARGGGGRKSMTFRRSGNNDRD